MTTCEKTLQLALSPYFLVTRELAAMLALVLAERVCTLLPEPEAGTSRSAVREAVEASPRYLRVLEALRWSGALWSAGVIVSCVNRQPCAAAIGEVMARLRREPGYERLAVLLHRLEEARRADQESMSQGRHTQQRLEIVSADLLKGGPDPGISVALTAAVDQFAWEHDLTPVRGAIDTLAQRAEGKLGTRLFSIAMPMLTHASGDVIVSLRHELKQVLDELRAAIVSAIERACGEGVGQREHQRLDQAARAYAAAFKHWSATNVPGDDEQGERLATGYVNVAAWSLPRDSALMSARIAMASMHSGAAAGGASFGGGRSGGSGDDAPGQERHVVLVVREMNIRPA